MVRIKIQIAHAVQGAVFFLKKCPKQRWALLLKYIKITHGATSRVA